MFKSIDFVDLWINNLEIRMIASLRPPMALVAVAEIVVGGNGCMPAVSDHPYPFDCLL
jgi:hypothetical protein